MLEFVQFALVGKLVIFVLQRFPFQKVPLVGKLFVDGKFLAELFGCDFCLGFWVYTILAPIFSMNVIDQFYIPIISWAITGVITSFIVHVFTNGWKALYNVTVIGD